MARNVAHLAVLCMALVGGPRALGNGERLFLDCPCRLQSDGTTLTISVGARSFRSTDSGSVRVRVFAWEEEGSGSHTVAREAHVADTVGAGARLASVSIDTPLESGSTGRRAIYLSLEERAGESWLRQDRIRMESRVDLTKPFDIGDLDYLEDGDGDGATDEGERLAGTDPEDAGSTPGATTVDVLAFYTRGYADLFGGDPVARIGHLFASANAMLEDSAVSLRLRVVGAVQVDVANEHEWLSAVDEETLLLEGDRHGADLSALFTIQPPNVPAGYGCAFAYRSRGHIDRDAAKLCHANVKAQAGAFVLTHELGHGFGLAHSVAQREYGAWRWSRGHDVPDDFTTIMSYGRGGTRLNVFSSPDGVCRGRLNRNAPCGVPQVEIDGADGVAALDAVRFQYALVRSGFADADGDGFVNPVDDLPDDPDEWRDTDGDGIGNNADEDDDGDGVADTVDTFPLDATETVDSDGDGVGDNGDPFPEDPSEWADRDGDGVGDNGDPFPEDPNEWADRDGDGAGDNGDLFPDDPDEWADTDGDGIGDNADPDADGDGVANEADLFPADAGKSDIGSYVFVAETAGDGLGQALLSTVGNVPSIVVGAPDRDSRRGAVYLIAVADLATIDAADGNADREIGLAHATAGPDSWLLVGEAEYDRAGVSAAPWGDLDGDGLVDLVIGARQESEDGGWHSGAVYVVSGADLDGADAADGIADRTVSLAHVAEQTRSWKIVGEPCDHLGASVAAGDVNGDGQFELILGAPATCYYDEPQPGAVHVVSMDELAPADAADDVRDGVVHVGNVAGRASSYRLNGESPGGASGEAVGVVGDLDGDGNEDFGIGAPWTDLEEPNAGVVHLISVGGLSAADAADGESDGVVELGHVAAQPGSWKVYGEGWSAIGQRLDLTGSGEVLLGGWSTHLLAVSDLAEIDAADGAVDGTIKAERIADGTNSWTLLNVQGAASAGDVDGDGRDEILFGRSGSDANVFAPGTLTELDARDGIADGEVPSWSIARDNRTWAMRRSGPGWFRTLAGAGDVDADGLGDMLLAESARQDSGLRDRVYLLLGADLEPLDDVDGSRDRRVRMGSVAGDTDGDGIGNTLDPDDDNDSFLDWDDAFQLDPAEWRDSDGDQVGDNADAFPDDWNEQFDTDGDGVGDNADEDDDGDGIADGEDEYPLDTDNDGIDNREDDDDDNDGVSDEDDDLPVDPTESVDTDSDGVGNNADDDDDNDGVADADDAFPVDPAESADSDGDGTGDNADAFPDDPDEQADADGDGTGDNADPDDDNDGVPDTEDAFPFDPDASSDADGDGVDDSRDAFPEDASESVDTDGDGVGNNADADDDNDGVADETDLFPLDADRWGLTSLKFVSETASDRLGAGVGTAGDLDGDGRPELLLGAPGHDAAVGAVYVVSSRDLTSADEADGNRDGAIALGHLAGQGHSWKLLGKRGNPAGEVLGATGDLDGNGSREFAVGATGRERGAVYLVSGADLLSADAADGEADGVVGLDLAPDGAGSWRIYGGVRTAMGHAVAATGSPGAVSVLLGQSGAGGGALPGGANLLSGSGLGMVDGADGEVDSTLHIGLAGGDTYFEGEAARDFAGSAVGVWDYDSDGLADVVIGAPSHDALALDDGAVYLVGGSDYKAGDSFKLARAASAASSFKFVGEGANDRLGSGVAIGDVDGDGQPDLILGAASGLASRAMVNVVSGTLANLMQLDAADGREDGLIRLRNEDRTGHWRITYPEGWGEGRRSHGEVSAVDSDGDGRADLLVPLDGAGRAAFVLLPGVAIAADASTGGTVVFETVAQAGYAFHAESDDVRDTVAGLAGDLDDDGSEDFLLGVVSDDSSAAYLIVAADLVPLDAADGRRDGVIHLANVVGSRR